MSVVSRCVVYVLLSAICLLFAGVAFGLGAAVGAMAARLSVLLVSVAAPNALLAAGFLVACGACLGGIGGLILIARLWWSMARESDDPSVRAFVQRADDLGRAMRSPGSSST